MNHPQSWLKLFTVGGFWLLSSPLVLAQIVPDETLGGERSRLTPNVPVQGANGDLIQGGAQREGNLFHSFREFNVNNGQRVYFANPTGVQNILTRVTGSNASNILGTLGINGSANLFFLNPNGILFGPNARLDVRGSFVGTTANSIRLGDQGEFSATKPSAPALLTVNPSALLFEKINRGSIVNRSVTPLGTTPLGTKLVGLQVPQGQSLALVGGRVSFEGGGINAPEGRIDIAAVEGGGSVELRQSGSQLSLSLPSEVQRSDVLLNNATLNVAGAGGGNLSITGRNINLTGNSFLRAGIESGRGSLNAQAGDIGLDATGDIRATERNTIANVVRANGIGNGGNIHLNARSVFLNDDAFLGTGVLGKGNGGNIEIDALDAVTIAGPNSQLESSLLENAEGKAGDITIRTGTFSLNQSLISNTSAGRGNAGNITIQADSVALNDSFISNDISQKGIGQGGDIRINAGSVSLQNFSGIASQTLGQGNTGNIEINALNAISLGQNTSIRNQVFFDGTGRGGTITINTVNLSLEGRLSTSTLGRGDAGNIVINARDAIRIASPLSGIDTATSFDAEGNAGDITIQTKLLSLFDLASISGDSFGRGNAGDTTIQANSIVLDRGEIRNSVFSGAIGQAGDIRVNTDSLSLNNFSRIDSTIFGQGDAGNVSITTNNLSLTDFSKISTSSLGTGNAGDIQIEARSSVSLDKNASIDSGFFKTSNFPIVKGNAGNILFTTENLSLTDGSTISTSSSEQGNAGNIEINARNAVSLGEDTSIGSQFFSFSDSEGVGKGGNITINAKDLSLQNSRGISSATFGRGDAGDITIDAANRIDLVDSSVSSNVTRDGQGNGGNIRLQTGSLSLTNGAELNAVTSGQGNAGNVFINARDRVSLDNSEIFSSVTSLGNGKAGSIFIDARDLSLDNKSIAVVDGVGNGEAGQIQVQAKTLRLNNESAITAASNTTNGGDINLTIEDALLLRRGSIISATAGLAGEGGNGGNITLNANKGFLIALSSEDSNITANASKGKGGNVHIHTQGIFGIQARPKRTPLSDITASSALGVQGQVTTDQPEVQPTQGTIELPTEILDTSNQVAQVCPRGTPGRPLGAFVVTGRGSVPPSPIEPLAGKTEISPLATIEGTHSHTRSNQPSTSVQSPALPTPKGIAPPERIEAQGWVKTRDGKVALVAAAPNTTSTDHPTASACPVPRQHKA